MDVGQVNPWTMDDVFVELLQRNVAALVRNFWRAGYKNVITGSFLRNYSDYLSFRGFLTDEASVQLIQLCASKQVRDERRIARSKPSTAQWRDEVDRVDPEDTTLAAAAADYRYARIDNDGQTVAGTIAAIKRAVPEIYS